MDGRSPVIDISGYAFEALRKDEEFILYRAQNEEGASQAAFATYGAPLISGQAKRLRPRRSISRSRVLVLSPAAEYPTAKIVKWLEHAYSLREELDSTWAARPITIARHWDRTVLVMEDPGGVPLDQLLGEPPDIAFWLRLAISLASAIDQLHQRGIIHKDIKPANVRPPGATNVAWGDWPHFVAYTAKVNRFLPGVFAPALAVIATGAEGLLGLALILGAFPRPVAWASVALLGLFGIAMTLSFGIKAPLNYSVFVDAAAVFVLGAWPAAARSKSAPARRR